MKLLGPGCSTWPQVVQHEHPHVGHVVLLFLLSVLALGVGTVQGASASSELKNQESSRGKSPSVGQLKRVESVCSGHWEGDLMQIVEQRGVPGAQSNVYVSLSMLSYIYIYLYIYISLSHLSMLLSSPISLLCLSIYLYIISHLSLSHISLSLYLFSVSLSLPYS